MNVLGSAVRIAAVALVAAATESLSRWHVSLRFDLGDARGIEVHQKSATLQHPPRSCYPRFSNVIPLIEPRPFAGTRQLPQYTYTLVN